MAILFQEPFPIGRFGRCCSCIRTHTRIDITDNIHKQCLGNTKYFEEREEWLRNPTNDEIQIGFLSQSLVFARRRRRRSRYINKDRSCQWETIYVYIYCSKDSRYFQETSETLCDAAFPSPHQSDLGCCPWIRGVRPCKCHPLFLSLLFTFQSIRPIDSLCNMSSSSFENVPIIVHRWIVLDDEVRRKYVPDQIHDINSSVIDVVTANPSNPNTCTHTRSFDDVDLLTKIHEHILNTVWSQLPTLWCARQPRNCQTKNRPQSEPSQEIHISHQIVSRHIWLRDQHRPANNYIWDQAGTKEMDIRYHFQNELCNIIDSLLKFHLLYCNLPKRTL